MKIDESLVKLAMVSAFVQMLAELDLDCMKSMESQLTLSDDSEWVISVRQKKKPRVEA
jgi:hypothetical protein